MTGQGQRRDWEDLATLDSRWAILSHPGLRFGGWDEEEFRRSGRQDVSELLAIAARLGLAGERHAALDFGCGAGRLTGALGEHFERCIGLDISAQMIEEARAAAPPAGTEFAVHEGDDLARFAPDSFDLVVSRFVLQHIAARRAKLRYIAELVRVLRPGGLLALQLPSRVPALHRLQPRPRLYGLLRRAGVSPARLYNQLHLHPIRMSALTCARVERTIVETGGVVHEVHEQLLAGGVVSCEYLAGKERATTKAAAKPRG
jgi:SAM-dependent methyltransferase